MSKALMAMAAALVLAGNTMADDYWKKIDDRKAADAAFFKKVDDRAYWKKVDDKKYWSEYDRKKAEETKRVGASFLRSHGFGTGARAPAARTGTRMNSSA